MENKMGIIDKLIDKVTDSIISKRTDTVIKTMMKDNPGLQKAVLDHKRTIDRLRKEFDEELKQRKKQLKSK